VCLWLFSGVGVGSVGGVFACALGGPLPDRFIRGRWLLRRVDLAGLAVGGAGVLLCLGRVRFG